MEASVDDTIAQTCIQLTKNSEMQNDVRERLKMQKEVGPLTTFARGKSIAELRATKRKKRNISPHVANCHIKDPGIDEVCGIITLNFSVASKKEQRWYNNHLNDTDSEISSTARTLTYDDDNIIAKEKVLEVKVVRRLIDNTSMTSKCKKIAFEKIYKNDKGVNAITNIATEIGSSVNHTK